MGVPPLLGREFTPSDAPGGNPAPVAVLSYIFWQKQFGGSRDVVGKTLELDHEFIPHWRGAPALYLGDSMSTFRLSLQPILTSIWLSFLI